MKWEDRVDVGGLSDVGMRRTNNQDSFRSLLASDHEQWRRRGHFFVVADGMGAHAVGELASKLAVDTIVHTYHKLAHLPCPDAIVKSFQDANTLIYNRGLANRDFQGMGTTSTALLLLPEGALVAHVGDSRAYRVRRGRIEQLSFDHSLRWELVRRRELTPEQAQELVPHNVITRSLGPEPQVDVDVEGPHPVEPGDVFVLCTDGLSGQANEAEIGALARHLPAQEASVYLVDIANLRGGPDNITVVVVRVGDPEAVEPDQATATPAAGSLINWNHPQLWLALGAGSLVCWLLLALVWLFFAVDKWSAERLATIGLSALAALPSVLLVVLGLVQRAVAQRQLEDASQTKNPYRRLSCKLDLAMLERLSAWLQELRATAVEQAWNVDWSEFFTHRNAADKAIHGGDLTGALREMGQALHQLALAKRRHLEDANDLLRGS